MASSSEGRLDSLIGNCVYQAHAHEIHPKDSYEDGQHHVQVAINNTVLNIFLEWENGEITTEPLDAIATAVPITCAIYARATLRYLGVCIRE